MQKHRLIPIGLLASAALLLSGCTSATAGAESESTDTTAELTASQQACMDAVSPLAEEAVAEVPWLGPTETLDTAALAGKSIWFITVTMNDYSTEHAQGVQEAAEAVGATVTLFDGQGLSNRFNEGITQAVAQGADGILLLGIDASVVSESLKIAADAGIPVQYTLADQPDAPVPANTYGAVSSDYFADGEATAEYAMYDSNCQTDMIATYSSIIPVWSAGYEGAKSAIEEYCPEDCTLEGLNIDLANMATDLGSQLQTGLQKFPDTNYIFAGWDSSVPYVVPVVSAAASDALVIGRDGVAANLESIINDDGQAATNAMPPPPYIGWLSFDDLAREMTGATHPGYVIPTRMVDSTNVGDGSLEAIWPEYVDYQQKFEDAWAGE